MSIKACLTSKSDNWSTPDFIYEHFRKLGFFDPCPLSDQPSFDGLSIPWKRQNFVNPPYSSISKWIDKSIAELAKGKTIVLLVPARTDTKWFYKLKVCKARFIFITGRLKFGSSSSSAPFPSMIAILKPSFTSSAFALSDHNDLLLACDCVLLG